MGNCQAVDAAALVIQQPCGRMDRHYAPITASDVMKMYPGHYVSLIIPIHHNINKNDKSSSTSRFSDDPTATVRFTRVKLLRPNETLTLGHAYRLITTQEVMSVLKAKKYAKSRKQQRFSGADDRSENTDHTEEEEQQEKDRPRNTAGSTKTSSAVVGASKSWRPTLQSIAEGGG